MKIKFIKKDGWYNLTMGKTYEVIWFDYDNEYTIINDVNKEGYYPKYWFKPLSKSEIRNEKINKLLEL
jgi:hypothetical protein